MRDRSNNFRIRLSDTRKDLVTTSNPLPVTDFFTELRRGRISDAGIVQKFGGQIDITTSYTAATTSGVYQTPQPASAVALRVKAGNTNDTAAGSGAREVTLNGLDETGAFAQETLATAGTSASSATTTTWLRLFRLWVSASGTYATTAAGSHAAAIAIETAGATEWAMIDATGYPKSQSQIACYTVPLGRTAYITSFLLTTDGAKPVDFLLLKRESILDAAAPYQAMRTVTELLGIQGELNSDPDTAFGPFPALTDIVWMAKGATTPDITIDFELIEFYN